MKNKTGTGQKVTTARSPQLAAKISEAAKILSLSPTTIRRLVQRGELMVVNVLRHTLIPMSEIHAFLARNSSQTRLANKRGKAVPDKVSKRGGASSEPLQSVEASQGSEPLQSAKALKGPEPWRSLDPTYEERYEAYMMSPDEPPESLDEYFDQVRLRRLDS